MKIALLILMLLCLASTKRRKQEYAHYGTDLLGINNITSFNAEQKHVIVFGNANGSINYFIPQINQVFSTLQAHNTTIIKIVRIESQTHQGYVTIDTQGYIVLWNEQLKSVVYKEDAIFNILQGQIISQVVISQHDEQKEHEMYMIALKTGQKIYEYCLNERKLLRTITKESGQKINSIAYIGKNLYASLQDSGLYVVNETQTVFRFVAAAEGSIDKLTTHQESDLYDDDGLAVLNQSSIIHFNINGFNTQSQDFNKNRRITSLNQCQSRKRRQKQDLFVVGYEDGTIIVKSESRVVQKHFSNSPIQLIQCEQDVIFYTDASNNLVMIPLDHLNHSRHKFSGIISILIVILVIIIVAFIIKRRREQRKKLQEQVFYQESVQLQERTNYQPPK